MVDKTTSFIQKPLQAGFNKILKNRGLKHAARERFQCDPRMSGKIKISFEK